MKAEEVRASKDHLIRNLNDEIEKQDNLINRINMEKKFLNDRLQKTAEELQVSEDKNNHLM